MTTQKQKDFNTVTIEGREYKTVRIGNQEWMPINLDIDVPGSVDNGIYGRLYTHNEALEAVKLYNLKHGTKWHLPTNAEWNALADALGGKSVAGGKMKSTTGWNDYNGISGNGTNESGLNMLPGGYMYNGSYNSKGFFGYWWSAESNSYWYLHYNNANLLGPNTWNNYHRFSVRCVKGICEEDRAEVNISEENAIKFLKDKGYKILKPVTKFKEI